MCKYVEKVKVFVEHRYFSDFMLVIVIINSITIGIATINSIRNSSAAKVFEVIDYVFLGFFILEFVLKFIVYRFRYFLNGWNIFDVIIIVISLIPQSTNISSLRALRAFKAFRSFKMIERISSLQSVVTSVFISINSVFWLFVFALIFFYIYAIIGVTLFGQYLPEYFGTLGRSLFTLTQIMTLEGFHNDMARPMIKQYWWSFLYFDSFVIIVGFLLTNQLVGIIVNVTEKIKQEKIDNETLKDKQEQFLTDIINNNITIEDQIHTFEEAYQAFNDSLDYMETLIKAQSTQ